MKRKPRNDVQIDRARLIRLANAWDVPPVPLSRDSPKPPNVSLLVRCLVAFAEAHPELQPSVMAHAEDETR